MNYIINLYPHQFKHDFYPVDEKQIIYCDCCKHDSRMFIELIPENKLICLNCSINLDLLKQKYPKLNYVQFPSHIVKKLLDTEVYCSNKYIYQDVYVKANRLIYKQIKDPYLKELVDDFNNNRYSRTSVDVQRPQGDDLAMLSKQLTGQNHKIQFFDLVPYYPTYHIDGCNQKVLYRNIHDHLLTCQYSYRQCQYCGYKTLQKFINIHQSTCKHKQVGCPICYRLDIELQYWCSHVRHCLKNCMQTADEKSQYDIEEDEELQIKLENIQEKLQHLSEKVLMWDNQLQTEVLIKLKQLQGQPPKKTKFPKAYQSFITGLEKLYKHNLSIYCIISQSIEQIVLDAIIQSWPNNTYIGAMICLVIQTINMIAFISFSIYFLTTQQFRDSTPQWMFLSYIALVIWFADKNQFIGVDWDDQSSIHIFYQFLYFSAIVGGKIGFGDMTPSRIISRTLVLCEAIYTTYILLVWFRGISFFIKVQQLMKYQQNCENRQKSIVETLDSIRLSTLETDLY